MAPDEPLEQPLAPETTTPEPADDLRADIMRAVEEEGGLETPAQERARDAQGRFTRSSEPQQPLTGLPSERAAGEAAANQQQQPPQGVVTARAGPPPGWSPTSKSLYEKLPEPIKADIAKREMEVSQGFAKLAEYKGLDEYVEMARNSRTTLPEALARYVNAENALEADPVNGLLWLCSRYRTHPALLLQAIGGGQGDQPPDPSVPQLDPRLAGHFQALDQRLGSIEQEREQIENQAISSQIHAFASDPANRYFENVRHHMAHIIRTAPQNRQLTLRDVYDEACWANPEIRELLISERSNGGQRNGLRTRAADIRRNGGSLPSGSPVVGGTLARNEPAPTLREEIERAYYDS